MLEDAIHEINNHNASGLSFEELYRYAATLRPGKPDTSNSLELCQHCACACPVVCKASQRALAVLVETIEGLLLRKLCVQKYAQYGTCTRFMTDQFIEGLLLRKLCVQTYAQQGT